MAAYFSGGRSSKEVPVPEAYDVKVLGPLPEAVLASLRCARIGVAEARTVLSSPRPDADRLALMVSRLSALGLELSEVRRGPRHTEIEIRGLVGPSVRAALSDFADSMARWRCVLLLRLPARRLTEVLQSLTDNGVHVLAIRAISPALAPAGW
jgi:hypothetical protein